MKTSKLQWIVSSEWTEDTGNGVWSNFTFEKEADKFYGPHGLWQMHDGDLDIRSAEGKGTTIRATLPT